jgi:hypothetical protein
VLDDELHNLINDESDEDEIVDSTKGSQEHTDFSQIKAKSTVMSNLLDLYSGLYRIVRAQQYKFIAGQNVIKSYGN